MFKETTTKNTLMVHFERAWNAEHRRTEEVIKLYSLANRSGADMNGYTTNMRGNNYLKIRTHSLTPCQAQAPYLMENMLLSLIWKLQVCVWSGLILWSCIANAVTVMMCSCNCCWWFAWHIVWLYPAWVYCYTNKVQLFDYIQFQLLLH